MAATEAYSEQFQGTDWATWAERLTFFFEAQGITDPIKKRAQLLTRCGPQTFATIRALLAPRSLHDATYQEIVELLRKHYDPQPSEVFSRCKFQRRDQQAGESINTYVTALRKLAADCNFGAASTPTGTAVETAASSTGAGTATSPATSSTMLPLDIMLRDRFVCGIKDSNLQQRLFAERDLTFSKALDFALRAESAAAEQHGVKASQEEVHKVKLQQKHGNRTRKNQRKVSCYRCEGAHFARDCKYKNARCRFCKKVGHIEAACRKKKAAGKSDTNLLTEDEDGATSLDDLYHVAQKVSNSKFLTTLLVNDKPVQFEVDSGAACSLIAEEMYKNTWPEKPPPLAPGTVQLKTWSGEGLDILGSTTVVVQSRRKKCMLPLLVIRGSGASLLGRNWFRPLQIEVSGINYVNGDCLERILEEHKEVFGKDIQGHRGDRVDIQLQDRATPKFCRARPVPFALREAVCAELQCLEQQGIIEPVQHSEWATPVVCVRKKDNTIRLCGDYRSTINAAAMKADYPLPTPDEVMSKLQGGTLFSTLDMTQAYQQLRVTETTAQQLTINTVKGLYKVKRLPFGIAAAPAIFQRFVEKLLAGIDGIAVYLDDIIISGADQQQHNRRLETVLARLEQSGLRLKKTKCKFARAEVEFLGHNITGSGVRPTDAKIRALLKAPEPTSKETLQSFLGMLAFYDRFLKDRATTAAPLYKLLAKNATWKWTTEHKTAFEALKEQICHAPVLAHYDPHRPLILSCDASPYGVGAVLAQEDNEGNERPVAFASRTLGPAERNYSQLDKEGLAIVYAVVHFHMYLAGRHVQIYTDHKPLLGILGTTKPVP
ncbi:uncharacterized protein K02A2.6-like [Ornithodoros turicata]|uniref:uncharacterized protein K02A2.6-like n=1 Tax=Ornithodoros turicata TaxID=34597 RepID=UPI003139A29A